MIPDLWSSRGESTTSKIGFYPGNMKDTSSEADKRLTLTSEARFIDFMLLQTLFFLTPNKPEASKKFPTVSN